MLPISSIRKPVVCALVLLLFNIARGETENDWLNKTMNAYSDYGSPLITTKAWEERAKVQFPELQDPNSTMQRFIEAEYVVLQKTGADVLKKPEAPYELAVLTAIVLRSRSIPTDKANVFADQFAANINKFDQLFVSCQPKSKADREPTVATVTQPKPSATPQTLEKVRTLEGWTSFIKSDAKYSSLVSLLGRPDGKEESQDNLQRYTTYRWWSKVDVGTKHTEDLQVKTVTSHGQAVIIGLINPSSDEEIDFPWSDATIWNRN